MPKITKAQGPSFEDDEPRDWERDAAVLNPLDSRTEADFPQQRDGEQVPSTPRPDYSGWTKAQLNAELDQREIEHDSKANNLVLVNLLEENDGGTQSGVDD